MNDVQPALRDLSDLIGVVYDSALEPRQWQMLLSTLNQRFPGFMGAVYTQEGEKFIGMYSPDGFNAASREVYEKHTKDGKVHGISEDKNDHRRELLRRIDPKIGDVYYSREIFTDEEFRRLFERALSELQRRICQKRGKLQL